MGKGVYDDIDFISEQTFKQKLPKLYKLAVAQAFVCGVNIKDFKFVNCEGAFDVIDVTYTNYEKDFIFNVRGSERFGYRILTSDISESAYEPSLIHGKPELKE